MAFKYPTAKKVNNNTTTTRSVNSSIPGKKARSESSKEALGKNTKKANMGMDLEQMINDSNEYYLANNIAVIHKKPTPVQIVKVDYPSRNKAVITEAYYKIPSTTDYNGIYKGKYIDFEAKESHSKTAFPLSNIHPHQIEHLNNIIKHGGIGFIIVAWSLYNEYYLVPMDIVMEFWNNALANGRKSISYDVFKNRCHPIKEGFLPRLQFLDVVDEYYIK